MRRCFVIFATPARTSRWSHFKSCQASFVYRLSTWHRWIRPAALMCLTGFYSRPIDEATSHPLISVDLIVKPRKLGCSNSYMGAEGRGPLRIRRMRPFQSKAAPEHAVCVHIKRLTVDGLRRIAHLYGAAVTSLFPYIDVYDYN